MSAWSPETAWLARWLRGRDGRPSAGGVRLVAAGVGAVDAGIGAARAIARWRPRQVIFLGTAGAYPGPTPERAAKLALGAAVIATHSLLVSTAVVREDGYLPGPMVARVDSHAPLARALLRAGPEAVAAACACPLAITATTRLATDLAAATGARVENLEAFSVLRAATLAGARCAAVLGIANTVGPDAHAEWRAHHVQASRAACQVVAAWLSAPR